MTKHTSTPDEQRALYSQWIKPGDLVFDIGAHVGTRTLRFLELGAQVIAVEPQPEVAARIPEGATAVVVAACSDYEREELLFVDDNMTYMSTLDFTYGLMAQPTHGNNYTRTIRAQTVTLDSLIATYGVPAFIKIDVEGHEPRVLTGLNEPVAALSFEVHTFAMDKAQECMDLLDYLGRYDYLFSQRESMVLEPWPPAEIDLFGDVYAVLV